MPIVQHQGVQSAQVADNPDADLSQSWRKVLSEIRYQNPRDLTDTQREAMIAAKTAELDSKVGKALGFYAKNQSEAVVNVVVSRCNHECRRELYEELMAEFDPARLEAEADY